MMHADLHEGAHRWYVEASCIIRSLANLYFSGMTGAPGSAAAEFEDLSSRVPQSMQDLSMGPSHLKHCLVCHLPVPAVQSPEYIYIYAKPDPALSPTGMLPHST